MEFTGSLPAPSVSTCLCVEGERHNTVGSDEGKKKSSQYLLNILYMLNTKKTRENKAVFSSLLTAVLLEWPNEHMGNNYEQ